MPMFFDGTAKAGHLMSLEVRQRDEHIRIHDRPSDLRMLDVLPISDRYIHIIRPLEAVTDEDRTADWSAA